MTSILFVCTGNMYRSPIAAEVFRRLLARTGKLDSWQVSSAGTWTIEGLPAPQEARRAAQRLGISIDAHRARMITRNIIDESDLILVMEAGHLEALQVEFPFASHKIHLLAEVTQGVSYDIPDPASHESNEIPAILKEVAGIVEAGYTNIERLAKQKKP